jgi:protein-tyrosine-phosphatase
MAMGLMRARLGAEEQDWRVESAGIWAQPGFPPAAYTLEVLRLRGLDLQDYTSRPITNEMVQDFNLILTMERNHRDAMRAAFPQYRNKIFMLSEMINAMDDVADPVGGPRAGFEDTAREIETILDMGYGRIQRLAVGQSPEKPPQIRP